MHLPNLDTGTTQYSHYQWYLAVHLMLQPMLSSSHMATFLLQLIRIAKSRHVYVQNLSIQYTCSSLSWPFGRLQKER